MQTQERWGAGLTGRGSAARRVQESADTNHSSAAIPGVSARFCCGDPPCPSLGTTPLGAQAPCSACLWRHLLIAALSRRKNHSTKLLPANLALLGSHVTQEKEEKTVFSTPPFS